MDEFFLEILEERSFLPGRCLAVLLVGSVASGWSNAKSDYDFYVVSAEPWLGADRKTINVPLDPPAIHTESFYAHGRRWEVTYWLPAQIEQLIGKVSWSQFDRDLVAGQILVNSEKLFLERLATCVPLRGADWLAQRRRELEESAFRSLMVTVSLGSADSAVEDALGQLESGDLYNAVLSAKRALERTVDALLEQHGQYGGPSSKWRPNRFLAANPSALSFDEYWAIETMRDFDPEDPVKWVIRILTLCQDLSMKIEI